MSAAAEILAACGRNVAAAAVVGLALGALALLLRRPLRRLPPRLQAWCWWLVAARLLLELAGAPAIELAWLPRGERIAPAALAGGSREFDWVVVGGLDEAMPDALPNESAAPRAAAPEVGGLDAWAWTGLGALWLVGVLAATARLGAGLRRIAGIVARATPVADAASLALFDGARALAGVERRVALASSTEIATPLATGLLRPTVLLPAATRLAPAALRLVLVHELLHVRRGDGWRALVPALARRLLFFHPLAAWVEREHALATEAACDAEVVARAEAPVAAYGELLVQFTLGAARRPRLAAAWSLVGPSIHRRLEMLAHDTLRPRQLAALAPLIVLALGAVAAPVRLVAEQEESAATVAAPPAAVSEPEAAEVDDGWTPAPPPVPPVAAAPAAPPAPATRRSAVGAPRAVAPLPPAPPVPAVAPALPAPPAMPALAPLPPLAPLAPVLPELRGADWLVLWERDAKLSIDAGRWAQRRAEELGHRDGRPVLLLGRGGETFVVRDAAAIAAVRDIFFAQSEAARAQAAVAREAAQAARERSRGAMEESRRAAAEMAREATHEAHRMARLASVEAQRVAELERELARSGGEALAAARERAAVAARELAQLEAELERVREAAEVERARRYEASREALEADRERLATELAELDAGSAESRRTLERRLAELERELERRLGEIFTRGLAAPLEP